MDDKNKIAAIKKILDDAYDSPYESNLKMYYKGIIDAIYSVAYMPAESEEESTNG